MNRSLLCLLIASVAGCSNPTATQPADDVPIEPKHYECHRTGGPVAMDGKLDDPAWAAAAWTDAFVDIEGDRKPRPRFRTRAKMLWDDRYFYIGAELEEPHVWATLTKHDEIVFHDNDFEVFIDPDGDRLDYYEIEINALGTIFDLLLNKPYSDARKGQQPAHHDWDLAGLRTAVHVDGTLNDPRDVDRAWTVEMALPWASLAEYAHRACPPKNGDEWRVNFSRVEWRHTVTGGKYRIQPWTKEDNWVWSPQGQINMHKPERWGYVRFVTTATTAP